MSDEMKSNEPVAEAFGRDDFQQTARLPPEAEAGLEKQALHGAIAKTIRDRGSREQYLTLSELCELTELEKPALLEEMEAMKAQEAYQDIYVYQGAKDAYYYTYPLLAHNYVKALVLAKEDDLARTIAEVVRYESKTYPRATKMDTFTKFPYRYTEIQAKRMLESMMKLPEYADLQTYESQRKNFYVFSTRHLTRARAESLVEYQEDPRMWM